jgi:hypothetical protein
VWCVFFSLRVRRLGSGRGERGEAGEGRGERGEGRAKRKTKKEKGRREREGKHSEEILNINLNFFSR